MNASNTLTSAWTGISENSGEWLPHISGAGIVTTVAASCLSIKSRHFINSSSFITGSLTFAASQIAFQFFNKQKYSPYIAIAAGAAATAAFAHLMAVPIITALFFAALGNAAKYVLDNQDISTEICGFNWSLKHTMKNLSCGASAGYIYALFTHHLGCRTAILAGIDAWCMTVITQVAMKRLLSESNDKKWGFAIQLTGVAATCYLFPVPAIANIFMIVIADVLYKSCQT